jgi:hypothetical protein
MTVKPLVAALVGVVVFGATVEMLAQRGAEPATPQVQTPPPAPAGGGGRRGRGPAGPAPTGRVGAPVDLVGTWVSVVTEDSQWRMRTPAKGDTTSVPLNPEGNRVANTWDPSMDGRCEAYGVGGIMRMPGRLKISWQDDYTLKIETDAGQQTRLLRFTPPPSAGVSPVSALAGRTLQGTSVAEWQRSGGAFDAFLERGAGAGPPRWGALKVTTTNVLPGWLRRNGVPYSQNATITEYFTKVTHPQAGEWFVVTTTVEDPTYLGQPFTTSSNFKKEPNDAKFKPAPCKSA